jgi:hypothetical protein
MQLPTLTLFSIFAIAITAQNIAVVTVESFTKHNATTVQDITESISAVVNNATIEAVHMLKAVPSTLKNATISSVEKVFNVSTAIKDATLAAVPVVAALEKVEETKKRALAPIKRMSNTRRVMYTGATGAALATAGGVYTVGKRMHDNGHTLREEYDEYRAGIEAFFMADYSQYLNFHDMFKLDDLKLDILKLDLISFQKFKDLKVRENAWKKLEKAQTAVRDLIKKYGFQ